MNKHLMLKQGVVAVALTLASSHIVLAQENQQAIQKVVVTGSNIKQIDAESATPMTIIKRAEIEALGVNSIRQLLDTLTASTSSLSDTGGGSSFASGASSASLRGLGKQSTLILLNSRRVAPYALADYNEVFTNLDSLPLDAVERVDVLRNGGSAIYGSDAVAGVINIITRGDFEGLRLKASHDRSTKYSDINTSTASLTGGMGNLSTDRYNVLANLEVFKRNNVGWRGLIDDINPIYGEKFPVVGPGSGMMFGDRGTPSTYSYPGNVALKPVGGCATLNSGGSCVYDRYTRFEARPSAERVNALLAAKVDLGNNLESFTEALFSRTTTEYMNAMPIYDSNAKISTWGRNSFISRMLPVGHPLNTTKEPAELRYRFADIDAHRKSTSDQYRVLTGLRGTLNNKYDWETAVGVMGGKSKVRDRGAISVSGFKKVIGDYSNPADGSAWNDPLFFNRDYKIGQQNSPEVLNALFPEAGYDAKMTQAFIDGKISGEVASFNGRPIGVAVGGDLRHEKSTITPTLNAQNGDLVGRGNSKTDASRYTTALFTEVNVPLLAGLDLTGAARVDKYKGFDAHVSPKVALRWEASKQLMLRATWESGFRAPNLTESAESTKISFSTVGDPKRCPAARTYANDLRNEAKGLPASDPQKAAKLAKADAMLTSECQGSVSNIVHNNPDLKPETSRSATLGFVLEPIKGTTVSLDYWNIKRKDEIENKSARELVEAEDTLPKGVVERLPLANDAVFDAAARAKYGVTAGALTVTNGKFENVSQTKTSGVDLAVASRINTGIGRLDLSGNATYLLEKRNYSASRNGWGDNLKGRYETPALVANASATLKTGDFANTLRITHEGSTTLQADYSDSSYTPEACQKLGWSDSECHVGSYNRVDYNLAYTGIKDLTVNLFIRNLMNKRAPLDLKGFDGVTPASIDDVNRRSVRVTLEYKFK